jgi:hypothetical protein
VLYAVSQTRTLRQVSNTPSDVRLLDISSTGHVLIAVDDTRMTLRGAPGAESAESDLSKFDFSHVDDISLDDNLVLFTEPAMPVASITKPISTIRDRVLQSGIAYYVPYRVGPGTRDIGRCQIGPDD